MYKEGFNLLSEEKTIIITKEKEKYVGMGITRADAKEKVKGTAKYVRDIIPTRCYYAKIVRSTKPHAKILKIDVSEALAITGVITVLTADDIPGVNFVDAIIPDKPFLAKNEVNYVGEEIAIVVATSKEIAEIAAEKVKVTYQELPYKISIDEEDIKERIICDIGLEKGDIDSGFKNSDFVVEATFETGSQEHAYIEPQGAFVDATGDIIDVKAATQCPYYVQKNVSKILGVPLNKVKVTATVVGGGFGGKEEDPSWIAALCALASYKVKYPVALIYNRDEDILATSKRHESLTKIKIGADKDGKFQAIQATVYLNGGAYGTISPAVLFLAVHMVPGPYCWPNVKVDGYAVKTNRPPSGAFRGFGAPQALFAIESAIDMLADKMNMSPIELRLINGLENKRETAAGHQLGNDVGFKETLLKAKTMSDFDKKWLNYKAQKDVAIKRGIGVAGGWLSMGLGPGGYLEDRGVVLTQFTTDGKLLVHLNLIEMGQGMQTVVKQMAADIFGLNINDVEVIVIDTLSLPDTGPTVASRTTLVMGNAIMIAAQKLKPKILRIAAEILKEPPKNLEIIDSAVVSLIDKSKSIPLTEVIREGYAKHEAFIELGWYVPPKPFVNEKGVGEPFYGYAFATHVAEVQVDMRTGKVDVLRVWAVHDSGKIINPVTASGQVEGGIVQGMGLALYENFVYSNGVMVNNNFTDYIIPSVKDVPEIKVFFVETFFEEGTFGSKGIGEIPLATIIPAITNAISNAIEKRVTKIPLTPEDLYFLIRKNNQ